MDLVYLVVSNSVLFDL